MADGLRCTQCGWQESDHSESLIEEPERSDSTGFEYSLTTCSGFSPDRKEVRAVQAQKNKEEDWTATVYTGRAQMRTIIMTDILSGRWGKGWQNVARQLIAY